MKTIQLTAVIVLSITIAMVTTVLIIMAVPLAKKSCPVCPPCVEQVVEDMSLNVDRRAPPLPPLPLPHRDEVLEYPSMDMPNPPPPRDMNYDYF